MTLAIIIANMSMVQISANDGVISFEEGIYAIVSVDTGKAINAKTAGYTTHTTVDGTYIVDGNKIDNKSIFTFTPTNSAIDDEFKIETAGLDDVYPLRAEGSNDYVFVDSDKRSDLCSYVVEKTGENKGYIKNTSHNKYFGIKDNGEILLSDNKEKAKEFLFIKNPVVSDFSLYIEHVKTKKLIQSTDINGNELLVAGDKTNISNDCRYSEILYGDYNGVDVVNFVSKAYGNAWKSGGKEFVYANADKKAGGWESIIVEPNGDGTVSFKDTEKKTYITVASDGKMMRGFNGEKTDNEKFIIHSVIAPEKVKNLKVTDIEDTSLKVSWDQVKKTIYTGYKVVATPNITSGKDKIVSQETTKTALVLKGLDKSTEYTITVQTMNGEIFSISDEVKETTKNGPRPTIVSNLKATIINAGIKVEWKAVDNATGYHVYRAKSAFSEYSKIGETTLATFEDNLINDNKYENYYKVVAVNDNGESNLSDDYTSLETELFGKNVIIFAESDDFDKIDAVVQTIFKQQNDLKNDAQFNGGHYSLYYKPGDYTETSSLPVGFYTHVGGLGETPYDVKLNNIEVPAYLDERETNTGNYWDDGGSNGQWRNATCNFWRSAENLSVTGEGEDSVAKEVTKNSDNWAKADFSWSVAQAAPLRRVYSSRNVRYDWSYGWASGGFTADCLFEGNAQTTSGQQYFTRNSTIKGDTTGTNLNNFNMGVESPRKVLPNSLLNNNGTSDWASAEIGDTQNVSTSITLTPKIKEKPFLFLDDDGEYKIFVPDWRENSTGVSWTKDDMGKGTVMPLEEFYITKEGDNAKTVNEQLAAGKNIFFTPGVYYAEEVIQVKNKNTIILGTGMATMIADNDEGAMKISDVDGVSIAGIIFDAGAHSDYLLTVGEEDSNANHVSNPTILQDIFFRVGGTTSGLTKADDAIIINSHDVVTDHFWIWRADHGAGVAWDGNVSNHGLIVNGDNVTCYALFNEHFNQYDTLWNGENGATYFYQNEKCYDPLSQETWMSHYGTTNGYAAYKVANKVTKHYAVGLGIYNVFINTGEDYDSSKVQIQMDNAVEVPNSEGVVIENVCVQTFAKTEGVLQKFNHIINGVGNGVSSGKDPITGELGEEWSRQFLISYKDGTAVYGAKPEDNQKGQFIGLVTTENIAQPMNETGDVNISTLKECYEKALNLKEIDYSKISWKVFSDALAIARKQLVNPYKDTLDKSINDEKTSIELWGKQDDVTKAVEVLKGAIQQLGVDVIELEKLVKTEIDQSKYIKSSYKVYADALQVAKAVLANSDATQQQIDNAYKDLDNAIKGLVDNVQTNLKPEAEEDKLNGNSSQKPSSIDKQNQSLTNTNKPNQSGQVKTGDKINYMTYAILGICAVSGMTIARKRRKDN